MAVKRKGQEFYLKLNPLVNFGQCATCNREVRAFFVSMQQEAHSIYIWQGLEQIDIFKILLWCCIIVGFEKNSWINTT